MAKLIIKRIKERIKGVRDLLLYLALFIPFKSIVRQYKYLNESG